MKIINVTGQTAAALIVAVIAFAGCEKVNSDAPANMMTITTAMKGIVTITFLYAGTSLIDWGDGSAPETITRSIKTFSHGHNFSDTTSRTVVVTGQDLTYLYCTYHQITALDVIGNAALTELICSGNELTILDVSKNTALTKLFCNGNELMSLDMSNNAALAVLKCDNNQLTSLDMSNNTALLFLGCSNNRLTHLDATKNTGLGFLDCSSNQLTAAGLNALFDSLNDVAGDKVIWIENNPGTADCDRSIARAKGWKVMD